MDDVGVRARALLGAPPAKLGSSAAESAGRRTGPPGPVDAQAIARQLKRARATQPGATNQDAADLDRLAASLVERAQDAMKALESGTSAGAISDDQAIALESVIRTRGRPALEIHGDSIEALDPDKHPGSGFWRVPLDDYATQLVRVAGATGAVTVRDTVTGGSAEVCGTAWLVRNDLVITNRHVLLPLDGKRLVKRPAADATAAALKTDYELMVDFAFDDGPPRTIRCPVSGVPFLSVDGDPVDAAILRIVPAPALLPLAVATDANGSKQLYLFGHPGRLDSVPSDVRAVFGTPNGHKRVCFGERLADPTRPGELVHDASTIGGFSGGCVLSFGSVNVSALHYYGDPVRGNRAIRAAALRAHAVAAFL